MWDETIPTSSFIHQRFYDLQGATVCLKPAGLVKKRLWSKKYPICVKFNGDEKENLTSSVSSDSQDVKNEGVKEKASSPRHHSSGKTKCLWLFGRTCREKEEWFRRLVAASAGHPWPTSTADLLIKAATTPPSPAVTASKTHRRSPSDSSNTYGSGRDMEHKRQGSTDSSSSTEFEILSAQRPSDLTAKENLSEYLKYMAKVMPATGARKASISGTNGSINKKDSRASTPDHSPLVSSLCEPQVLWANALISRLFWDFLREQYWCQKMTDKLQKKLSKIHVSNIPR